jgi:putative hydrolase of the HAD superfamily
MMTNHTIKAVLLDYGGVIADEGFQNTLRAICREQGLDETATLQVAKHVVYDSGFILGWGTEETFWQSMRDGAGLKGSDSELTRRVLEGFVLRPWMIEWVKQLRSQGYGTVILSDQSNWLDWLDQRDHFFQHFTQVFNSYHMGKGKRDPSLFLEIAEKLALSPSEILFVDDMQSNIARAQSAGWNAIRYLDKASFLEESNRFIPSLSQILGETGEDTSDQYIDPNPSQHSR